MYRATGIACPGLIEPRHQRRHGDERGGWGESDRGISPSPIRRARIRSLIEALGCSVFSREQEAIFHADPHAGNLLYDETNRELVVLTGSQLNAGT